MSSVAPEIQRSFAGGEQSPQLAARADLARYKTSLQTMENFCALIRGGAERRPGFRDILAAYDISTLREFAFSDSDAYAIEFGVEKARFFRDYGVLLDGGTPYEIDTPFLEADLPKLCTAQSADTLYIATGTRPVQMLKRLASTNWTIADMVFRNGPFRERNSDESIVLQTANATVDFVKGASFDLTASAPLFDAGMVGVLYRLEFPEQDTSHGKWSAGNGDLTTNSRIYWGENFYVCSAIHGIKTGDAPPVHLVGAQWDGTTAGSGNARRWAYKHSGWGIVKITAFTDAQTVTVEAQTYIPDEVRTTGTWRWSEGAFSDYRGHPAFVAIHKKRLYLMSTPSDPTGGWASVIDDYSNHDPGIGADAGNDDKAFSFRLEGNNGKVNLPRWLLSAQRLAIGTAGDEHVLIPASAGPITPDNFEAADATTEGCAAVRPVRVEGVLFVSADGERVMELTYDPNAVQQDAFVATDLTLFADHIGGPGIIELAWQREPYRLLWALRSDGVLAACTFRKDQQVTAWHRHPSVKGVVEHIVAIPAPEKKRQDLWAIVTRTLAAGTVRRIECLMPFFQKTTRDVRDAFFVDGGGLYVGDPITHVTGLARFNGETVAILADGKVVPPQVVVSGGITLPKAAAKVTVGLRLAARLATLRCDKDALGGPLTGKNVRSSACIVDVMDTAGAQAAAGGKDYELLRPSGGAVSDAPAELFTGPLEVEALAADAADNQITVLCDTPLPAFIRAITPHYQVVR